MIGERRVERVFSRGDIEAPGCLSLEVTRIRRLGRFEIAEPCVFMLVPFYFNFALAKRIRSPNIANSTPQVVLDGGGEALASQMTIRTSQSVFDSLWIRV